MKRTGASGCVGAAGCVAHKRPRTGGCIEEGACVAHKRERTGGCIEAALCVVIERIITDRRVVEASCIVKERSKTDRRVVKAGCKAIKRIFTLSSVRTGIASAWCRINRSSCWRKRKAGERKQNRCEHYLLIFHKRLPLIVGFSMFESARQSSLRAAQMCSAW
jgi:hypothetical protein